MSDKPHLRLIACHRGRAATTLHGLVRMTDQWVRIPSGPLRGCWRSEQPNNKRSILKLGKGLALEFVLVIRVSYP